MITIKNDHPSSDSEVEKNAYFFEVFFAFPLSSPPPLPLPLLDELSSDFFLASAIMTHNSASMMLFVC